MNSAKELAAYIEQMIGEGRSKTEIIWNAALFCAGWPYVYGARGDKCEPVNRRNRYSDEHPTIKTACKNFDGSVGCGGCKWYPDGERVRCFDCRGFTYYLCEQVGIRIEGGGATSQWNTASNWKDKGEIASMPKDTLCCLFVKKGNKMEHTGFGYNNETVECSVGVQHFTTRNKKWTHWAVPYGLDGEIIERKPTIKRGSQGPYVTMAQVELMNRGYSVGASGADGIFGKDTEKAVKAFQGDEGLTPDGIIGPKTWEALDKAEPTPLYTVTIPHVTKARAATIVAQYEGATMTEEPGRG